MKRTLIVMAAVLTVAACTAGSGRLEVVRPDDCYERCLAVYPRPPFRLVHRIRADFPGGRSMVLLGVTAADRLGRRRSLLVTAEGMVLFDASRTDGATEIHRAVPPFNRPEFAEGLLDDVGLLMAPPPGRRAGSGRDSRGRPVCIWKDDDGAAEMIVEPDGVHRLWTYGPGGRLRHEAVFRRNGEDGPVYSLHLESFGSPGYELKLTLVEEETAAGGEQKETK